MINLHFFPSRRIAFYTVRLFLTRSLAVLVALAVAFAVAAWTLFCRIPPTDCRHLVSAAAS